MNNENSQKTKKLKIQLLSIVFLLVLVVISGLFLPDLKNIAKAINNNYSKAGGSTLTVDEWNYLDEDFLDKHSATGDSMAGPLTLPGDPTQPMHAATRQYVDAGNGGGETYINWGNNNCPLGTVLYSGQAFGTEWTKEYGSGDTMCIQSGNAGASANLPYLDGLWPMATGQANYMPPGILAEKEVSCALCYVDTASVCVEIHGSDVCPAGFDEAYGGYMLGGGGGVASISNNKSDRHCVNTDFSGDGSTTWGAVWYGSVIEDVTDVSGYSVGTHIKCAVCCN